MKALVIEQPNQYPVLRDMDWAPETGKVRVDLHASALNHRDVWICKGLYPGIRYPVVPGSDGSGLWDGREVVINPSLNWGSDERFPRREYSILGMPENGTFSAEVRVVPEQIYDKPAHLNALEAAALPLAGLTAYRALIVRGAPLPGDRVLITGVGGGVALFALQFALALKLEAYVTSGSREKIGKAMALGAAGGVSYLDTDWPDRLKAINPEGFDIVIDGAGGTGFSSFIPLARPGGRIVSYGGTRGKTGTLNTQQIFWKQLTILGSTMGSDRDFSNMLAFVSEHRIVPVIDSLFGFDEVHKAFTRMEEGKQFGKIVFQNR